MIDDEENYINTPVKFFYREVKMGFKSKEAGKPITERREFISIVKSDVHGKQEITDREVKPLDIRRYGKAYENWKNNVKDIQEGTLIEFLPGIDDLKAQRCKELRIFTLEQLVNIDGVEIRNLGDGGPELVAEAKKYLQGTNAVEEMQEEFTTLKAENIALKKENQELREMRDDITNNGTERSERDAISPRTDNGDRECRSVHEASPVILNEARIRALSTA